jgi:hypothetical protein
MDFGLNCLKFKHLAKEDFPAMEKNEEMGKSMKRSGDFLKDNLGKLFFYETKIKIVRFWTINQR